MVFAHLILAHLLGDFILQPSKLVHWKMRSDQGIFVHVLIHFTLGILILSPLIYQGYTDLVYIVGGICALHFLIDQSKINYDLKHDEKVAPFLLDQLLHFIAIGAGFFIVRQTEFILPDGLFYQIYANISVINFISILVLIGAALEVYRFQLRREKNKNARMHFDMKRALIRILAFTLIYLALIVLSFYVPALRALY